MENREMTLGYGNRRLNFQDKLQEFLSAEMDDPMGISRADVGFAIAHVLEILEPDEPSVKRLYKRFRDYPTDTGMITDRLFFQAVAIADEFDIRFTEEMSRYSFIRDVCKVLRRMNGSQDLHVKCNINSRFIDLVQFYAEALDLYTAVHHNG